MTLDLTLAEPRRFEPDGPVAIAPSALSRRYAARAPVGRDANGYPQPFGMVGDVAVVTVDGPLMQRGGGYYFDGYDAVCERARAAFADPKVRAVVLKLSSPGGMCAGMMEASRALRAMAAASGKPLLAYADEQACSAAYGLACAASWIGLPPSGDVGSVGVLSGVMSMKRAMEEEGVDFVVVRSGKMKALGHPADPISAEAVAREQADVDDLAKQFWSLVASARGMTVDAAAALEGDTRLGAAAVSAGLADEVCTWEQCLSRAGAMSPGSKAAVQPRKAIKMDEKQLALLATVSALTGETDPERATGKVAAWKESNDRVATLQTENAQLKAQVEQRKADDAAREREAIIVDGERTMKLSPAKAAEIRGGKSWHAGLSNEGLRAHVAELQATPAANAVQQPTTLPALGGTSATGGKAAEVDVESITLTEAEKRAAKQFGNSEADVLAMKKRDARGEVV